MKNTKEAFLWITEILERHHIPYKVTGGFAARLYGVDRALADIDFEIPDKDMLCVVGDVKPFIIYGPDRYQDENWDLQLMTLNYEGQEIDLAGTGMKMYHAQTMSWENNPGSLKDVEYHEVFGKRVPVETRASLIEYKTILGRDVDLEDVRQLTATN